MNIKKVNLTENGPQTSLFYTYETVLRATNVIWTSNHEDYYYETNQATIRNVN